MIPDTSNFYSSLHTHFTQERIAGLFRQAGWEVRKTGWYDFEVTCSWAELVIEAENPILLHGCVADVETNAERVLTLLREAGGILRGRML